MTSYASGAGATGPTFGCAGDAGRVFEQLRDAWLAWAAEGERRGGSRGWAPPNGPGWAGGAWWGGPDFPWGGRRGGGRKHAWSFEPGRPRAGRGDVRLAILSLLAEGPRHGYQLIQEIAERSRGGWNPSPGSVYPALSSLQDEGLIDDEKVDGKRVFSLTEAGRAYVAERADDLSRVFAENEPPGEHEDVKDLRELIWGVGGAALTVMGSGTSEQREQAREILARARRDLYRILAQDEEAE